MTGHDPDKAGRVVARVERVLERFCKEGRSMEQHIPAIAKVLLFDDGTATEPTRGDPAAIRELGDLEEQIKAMLNSIHNLSREACAALIDSENVAFALSNLPIGDDDLFNTFRVQVNDILGSFRDQAKTARSRLDKKPVKAKGHRPPDIRTAAFADAARDAFEVLTGNDATATAKGKFVAFLAALFKAMDINAGPQSQAAKAVSRRPAVNELAEVLDGSSWKGRPTSAS